MKRIGIGALALLALIVTIGWLRGPQPAHAQDEKPQNGKLAIDAMSKDESIHVPVMYSVISNGKVLRQGESQWIWFGDTTNGSISFDKLPVGEYDVRAEGVGLLTVVKRGIHILPNEPTHLIIPVSKGEGVQIIEFATGGLSREEIAARLKKLEAAVEELKKKNP